MAAMTPLSLTLSLTTVRDKSCGDARWTEGDLKTTTVEKNSENSKEG